MRHRTHFERLAEGFKPFINSVVLFVCAIGAHLMAGGDLVTLPRLVIESLGIFVALSLLSSRELEGPGLALISLLTQSTAHFTLGAATNSNLLMTLSHISGGLLSYVLITKAENFWKGLSGFTNFILKTFNFFKIPNTHLQFFSGSQEVRGLKLRFFCRANGLRAPPVSYAI